MEKSIGDIVSTDEIIFAPISQSFQMPICNKSVTTEISEEFILPDYLPEIRRLLRVTPNIPIPSQYIGATVAEFSGNIGWNILYVCGDGTLSEAYFSSPYEVSAELDENSATEYIAFIETIPQNISGKVTAPRKMNVRARLSHNIRAYGNEVPNEISYDSEDIKKLYKIIPTVKILSGVDNTVELVENMNLGEKEKIVSKHGTVIINEAEISPEGIICKGNVSLKLIIQNENKAYSTEKIIPFSSYVPLEIEGDAWKCRAYGRTDDIELDSNESGTEIRIRLTVMAEAQRNQPSQITADIFSTKQITAPTFHEIALPCSLCTGAFDFSHEGSANIDGLPDGAEVIDVIVTAEAEKISFENEKYILLGKCKYNVLYGSVNEYSVRESEFPFSCELISGTEPVKDFTADICALSSKVRSEGENMAFSSDLRASVDLMGETPIMTVDEVSFGDDLPARSSAFTVAYTADGDSLWNIAKKYAVDPLALAKSNGIKKPLRADDTEALSGIKYLII